jgi:hypothetical protein
LKKILVALASLAIALAANLGIASAHPFRDPTPSSEPAPRVDKNTTTTTTASPENALEADEMEANEIEANEDADKAEADEDKDEDEVDEEKDEDDADEDEADDDDTTRTAPVMGNSGRGDRHHDGERDRSGSSGHDGHEGHD